MSGCGGATPESGPVPIKNEVSVQQIREIAEQAYIYGYPMVDNYRIQYSYFVDRANPQYKGGWNEIHSDARVYTSSDTTIQTPNSDTPYSALGADLRVEPLVLTVPPIDGDRYYSVQFVDAYTYNFAYAGTRTTGNGGGRYLLAGPNWQGTKPDGVDEVLHSDTDFVLALYRTQLFGPDDIDNVKAIQAGYTLQPLSAFLKKPATAAPAVDFIKPISAEAQKSSLKFFEILSFVLRYAPVLDSEKDLRAKFASIGIGPDGGFDAESLSPPQRQAFQDGITDAWKQFDGLQAKITAGSVSSGDLFGTREMLAENYLYRMAGAVNGIYGNTKAEAMYPFLATDAAGAPLDGANTYTYRFAPGQLPPVHAFWSLTMYRMPQSLLVANPINRYLINSPMLSQLAKDPDGGYTIYIQQHSPGPDKESNWLPAPAGPFRIIERLYWPDESALNGTWQPSKPDKT
ncbi:DUF1254 domain-containing protein [Mycolicibacter sinensis]|uniref:Cell envelope protein n=1 Tax=Mycolicibacter sinensis (strain JDM601) TaxID=875328 RepID=A0A1A3TVQ6_MYCSD|nr:DUF1254 domain-containing protein [Mycolicibacter sinensis]OBK86715.1 cell envelope protein [Mycolicibacter sinensis]